MKNYLKYLFYSFMGNVDSKKAVFVFQPNIPQGNLISDPKYKAFHERYNKKKFGLYIGLHYRINNCSKYTFLGWKKVKSIEAAFCYANNYGWSLTPDLKDWTWEDELAYSIPIPKGQHEGYTRQELIDYVFANSRQKPECPMEILKRAIDADRKLKDGNKL